MVRNPSALLRSDFSLFPEPNLTHTPPSLVEEYVGIVCACLPCLKAFSKRFFPNLFVFNPAFEQRLSSSLGFPLSVLFGVTRRSQHEMASTNVETQGIVDGSGESGNGNGHSDGGRRAWWGQRQRQRGERSVGRDGGDGGEDGYGSGTRAPGGGEADLEAQGQSQRGSMLAELPGDGPVAELPGHGLGKTQTEHEVMEEKS